MPADTGAHTHVNYLWEDNGFAQDPSDSTYKTFGSEVRFNDNQGSNQMQEVLMPGTKIPIDMLERTFDGSWSMEFSLTNPWWLRGVFGSPSTSDNGDGSHTHTYDGTSPDPMRIVEGYTKSGKEREFRGCVPTRARLRPQGDQNVQVTLDGLYAEEGTVDPADITSQTTPSNRTMTFAQAEVKVDGSTKSLVTQGSLTIPLNTEFIFVLGQRTAADYITRARVPEVNITQVKKAGDVSDLQELYGGDGTSQQTDVQDKVDNDVSVTFVFDNGNGAGSGINKMEFKVTGSYMDSYSETGIGDPDSRIEEDINRMAKDIKVTATNETSTAP